MELELDFLVHVWGVPGILQYGKATLSLSAKCATNMCRWVYVQGVIFGSLRLYSVSFLELQAYTWWIIFGSLSIHSRGKFLDQWAYVQGHLIIVHFNLRGDKIIWVCQFLLSRKIWANIYLQRWSAQTQFKNHDQTDVRAFLHFK